MKSETQGSISVTFASAPDGAALTGGATGQRSLNLESVSNIGGAQTANVQVRTLAGRFVVSTKFSMIIQDASQHTTSATVLAALALPDPSFIFRLDGIKLQPVPQILANQARTGTTLVHRLEIEVPVSVTEKNSQLNNAIIFQVIPN